MKKLIPLFTFTLFLHLSLSAAVPLRWTVETSRAVPAQFEAYQGETLALEAALMSYGKPLESPLNYSLYWQTNGMGSTYWEVKVRGEGERMNDSTVHLDPSPTNVLFATWSPTNDVGARVYNCFIGQPGTIYHAAFQLRLRPSPGATPNELPLPQKVIDFAKVTVLNPPWSGGGGGGGVDTNTVREIVQPMVASATNDLSQTLKDSISTSTNFIAAQIAALQSAKRGLTDRDVYAEVENTDWTWTSEDPQLVEELISGGYKPSYSIDFEGWLCPMAPTSSYECFYKGEGERNTTSTTIAFHLTSSGYIDPVLIYATATRSSYMKIDKTGDRLATDGCVASAIAAHHDSMKQDKITASGILRGDGQGGVSAATKSSTSADPASADYRDPQDNTCHKTEFGEWAADIDIPDDVERQPVIVGSEEYIIFWYWKYKDSSIFRPFASATTGKNPDFAQFDRTDDGVSFFATRSAVCTDGEKFVTEDVVDGKVSAAVSTNNPAFVSAVRNTPAPEPGQGEDPPWGTWGTLGAAIAGLVSGLAWLKNKIGVIFDNEGEIQDDFAADILGKQVAIQKIDERLPIPISEKNAGFTTESYKRFVVTVSGNMTVTLHTPQAKQGDGYDAEVFECRFDGASLAADASIAFNGATATTMDTNCGTVTAGKVALMSAFWNGATWDVNWKVEG